MPNTHTTTIALGFALLLAAVTGGELRIFRASPLQHADVWRCFASASPANNGKGNCSANCRSPIGTLARAPLFELLDAQSLPFPFSCAFAITSQQSTCALVAHPAGHGCGYPGSPAHASVAFTTETIETGTIATYTCDNGYELLGPPRRTCGENGTWTPQGIPFCGKYIARPSLAGRVAATQPA